MSFVCQSQETELIFSQELSSTNAQLLSVSNLHRNDPWLVIRTKMAELKVLFNFVSLDFRVLFVLSSSFFSQFYSVTKNIVVHLTVNPKK